MLYNLYNLFNNKKLNYEIDIDEYNFKIRLYADLNKNFLYSILYNTSKKLGITYEDEFTKKEIISIDKKNFSLFFKKIKKIVEKIKSEVNKDNKNIILQNEKISKIEFKKINKNFFLFEIIIIGDAIWLN